MTKIPIKIKKNIPGQEINGELKIDLRAKIEPKPIRPFCLKWGVFGLALIISVSLIVWFLKQSQPIPFVKIVPQERIALAIVNQEALYNQILPFHQNLWPQSSFYQGLIDETNNYLTRLGLDFSKDVLPLFKKQSVIASFPVESGQAFPFIIILQKEGSSAKIDQILNQLEQELKKDLYLSSQVYRQIKITDLKPLSSNSSDYFYSQTEEYLIIGNSLKYLEKTVDLIIR